MILYNGICPTTIDSNRTRTDYSSKKNEESFQGIKQKHTMSAWILVGILKNCNTHSDVKSIEKKYKDYTFIGGEEALMSINKEYERLGIENTITQ